ncbi:Dynactin Subunit 1 [Manis pentadactyla]|nr:Dynactin Subunit 1 [Manis pentadactyla]
MKGRPRTKTAGGRSRASGAAFAGRDGGWGAPVRPRPAGPRAAAPCSRTAGLPAPLASPGDPGRDGGAVGPSAAAAGRLSRRVAGPCSGAGASGPRSGDWAPTHPFPRSPATAPPTPIPVIVAFIYPPPLRCGRPGRGGAGGLAGVGWGGRAVRVRCSRGPESFLLGPIWGLPSLRGVLVPALATPEGEGESLGYFETLCQFPSIEDNLLHLDSAAFQTVVSLGFSKHCYGAEDLKSADVHKE